ncbi:MAG: helix-turn-helix domain-containing protein [Phycisphaerales bacterium]
MPLIELRAWLVLFRFADRHGRVRVSHGRIAALAGVRREHAARATRALERRGLLRVPVRGRTVGERGRRTTNEYELLASPPPPPGDSAARDSPEESDDAPGTPSE